MARVVQRSGPPYLAIVFVFLFFIAAILAGWFYAKGSEMAKRAQQFDSTLNSLSKRGELNDDLMSQQKNRASQGGNSVIGQYRQDQGKLIEAIAGSEVTIDQALAISEEILKDSDGKGLKQFMTETAAQTKALQENLAAQQQMFADLKSKTDADAEAAAAAAQDLGVQLDEAKQAAAAAQQELEKISNSYSTNVSQANDQWSQRVDELQTQIAQNEEQIRRLQQVKRDLEEKLRKASHPDESPKLPDAAQAADAKIIKVLEGQDVVYIDIGANQGVRIGLPFTVYSQRTGVIPESDGKARIIVKNVGDRVAECQILRQDPSDPVSLKDPVANAAFNIGASPLFVVAGSFDLDEDGRIDRDGLAMVRSMIERFGGRLTDTITVEVDYVVLGSKPIHLTRPGADAPASEHELWRQNEMDIENYDNLINTAINYNKPILNTNRFKTFIGFVPEMNE